MDLQRFKGLPDGMEPEETAALFRELLAINTSSGSMEAIRLAEAFCEVAERHWHTYTLLDNATRMQVDGWVMSHWDRDSVEMTEVLTEIIGHLGLVTSADMLRYELHYHQMPALVRFEIEEALREYGSTVGDPYSGMRGCEKPKAPVGAQVGKAQFLPPPGV